MKVIKWIKHQEPQHHLSKPVKNTEGYQMPMSPQNPQNFHFPASESCIRALKPKYKKVSHFHNLCRTKLCNMVFNAEGGKRAKDGRETSLHLSPSLAIRGRMNKHENANQKRPQRP